MRKYKFSESEFYEFWELKELLDYLFEEEINEKLFQRWIHGPQFEKSFDDFKIELMPVKEKNEEEIMEKVFSILKMMEGGGQAGSF